MTIYVDVMLNTVLRWCHITKFVDCCYTLSFPNHQSIKDTLSFAHKPAAVSASLINACITA